MEVAATSDSSPVVPSSEPELEFDLASAWGYVGKLLLCMLVAGLILVLCTLPFGHSLSSDTPVMKLLLYVVPFLLFAYYLHWKGNLGQVLQPEVRIKQVPVVLYLLIVLLIPAMQVVLEPVVNLIPMPEFFRAMFEKQFGGNGFFTFITIVIAAPVLEELLMRGMLLRGLLKNYSPAKAIIWSSVMFAVLHLNPWQGIFAFALGLVLGWIYYHTRSIWVCIFLHFANNFIAWQMGMTLLKGTDMSVSLYSIVGNTTVFSLIYGSALIILLFSLFQMKRVFS